MTSLSSYFYQQTIWDINCLNCHIPIQTDDKLSAFDGDQSADTETTHEKLELPQNTLEVCKRKMTTRNRVATDCYMVCQNQAHTPEEGNQTENIRDDYLKSNYWQCIQLEIKFDKCNLQSFHGKPLSMLKVCVKLRNVSLRKTDKAIQSKWTCWG